MKFETLSVSTKGTVALIELNRPEKANAVNGTMWQEIKQAFEWLSETSHLRIGIFSAKGKHFTAGIDLGFFSEAKAQLDSLCEATKGEQVRQFIIDLQESVSAIEKCTKPVIAAVHGLCYGGGVDLITACDIRYATKDSKYSVKEVDLGIVADIGTLQRLPKLIGEGMARELTYTAREFSGSEAKEMGLVTRLFDDKASLDKGVFDLADSIASKSPLAIRGIKEVMNYSRDRGVEEGLDFVASVSGPILMSKDVEKAVMAFFTKTLPTFDD